MHARANALFTVFHMYVSPPPSLGLLKSEQTTHNTLLLSFEDIY